MSTFLSPKILTALQQFQDPYLKQNLASVKAIRDIQVDGKRVHVDLVLGYPAAGVKDEMIAALKALLAPFGITEIEIALSWKIEPYQANHGANAVRGVKNIIAVASGKGGVGKSTTAVNLALALKAEGATAGILDADIHGPNQPQMLGVSGQTPEKGRTGIKPIVSHGIQSISIGYLIDVNTPMIWRGPMVSQALQQLLRETEWDNLDYLIVDLPPGTGDVQLTLAQKIPVTGAVIVTTPQDIALLDARKGLEMFRKVKIPVLGVIENMSIHICSQCGHQEHTFGSGGAARLTKEAGTEFFGALPLDITIREQADSGNPTVACHPEGAIAKIYRNIARRMAAKLSLQGKNYSFKIPNIVIQND